MMKFFACVFGALLILSCVGADSTPAPSPTPSPNPCGGPSGLLASLNRPTLGYSACAVAPDSALFEIGYQNEIIGVGADAQVQTQYPQNFLRLGVASRFEVDVIGPNEASERIPQSGAPDAQVNGSFDSGLGFKYEFAPHGASIVAIDGLYTAPTGNKAFTAGNATFTGNLDVQYALGPETGIGTTLAFTSSGGFSDRGAHSRYGVFSPTVALTQGLPHQFQPYFEYGYTSRVSPSLGGRSFIDYGVQKLLGENTEIDLELGHALTADPSLKFNYVGFGLGILVR